jgi:hypothetical protein
MIPNKFEYSCRTHIIPTASHHGGAAQALAAPAWCVGLLWPPSYSSLDLWKLPDKIRLQELVSSNSENISYVSLLKHKNSRK